MSNKNQNEQNQQDRSTRSNDSQQKRNSREREQEESNKIGNEDKKKGGVEPMDNSRLSNENAE